MITNKQILWAMSQVMKSTVIKNITVECEKICDGWGWACGGCFAFAEALTKALPNSELWVVASKDTEDWASEHAIVSYNGSFYDATGSYTEKQLLNQYGKGEHKLGKVDTWIDLPSPDCLWYPQQEFVTDKEIKQITQLLKKYLKIVQK